MKKGIMILLSALLLLALAACGGEKTTGPEVDYGSSELYSKEEMDAAITAIRAEFDTWDGCELHALRYAGDESTSQENLPFKSAVEVLQLLLDQTFKHGVGAVNVHSSPHSHA